VVYGEAEVEAASFILCLITERTIEDSVYKWNSGEHKLAVDSHQEYLAKDRKIL
jgi:hypothetical protein